MGFFDISKSSFKRTDDGKIIYYPWGSVGYFVTESTEKRLRRLILITYWVAIFIPTVVLNLVPNRIFGFSKYLVVLLAGILLVLLIFKIIQNIMLSGSEKIYGKMNMGDTDEKIREKNLLMGESKITIVLCIDLLMSILSLFGFFMAKALMGKIITAIAFLFFGSLSLIFIKSLQKIKEIKIKKG